MNERTRVPMRLGIVPWEGRAMNETPALWSAVKLLRERYEPRRCDDQGLSGCERCNVMFLVDRVEYALRKHEAITDSEASNA